MKIPQRLEGADITLLLADRLRSETRSRHRALEAMAPMRRLFDADYTLREYAGMLSAWAAFFQEFDSYLSRCVTFAYQPRLPALERDLHTLGHRLAQAGAAHRHDRRGWQPNNEAERIGALYVIEGSTLGGKVITRHLRQHFGSILQGAMHFYGLRTVHWPEFKARLDQWEIAHPEQVPMVIDAANRTFETIGAWMEYPPASVLR